MYQVNSISFDTADQAADYIADSLDHVFSAFIEEDGYHCMKCAFRGFILDNIEELRPGQSTLVIGNKVTRSKIKKEQA